MACVSYILLVSYPLSLFYFSIMLSLSASLDPMARYILSFLSLVLEIFNFKLITNDTFQLIKVADFGVARVKAESGVMTAETGTYRWMAPEVNLS
jgi:hypothetical protein